MSIENFLGNLFTQSGGAKHKSSHKRKSSKKHRTPSTSASEVLPETKRKGRDGHMYKAVAGKDGAKLHWVKCNKSCARTKAQGPSLFSGAGRRSSKKSRKSHKKRSSRKSARKSASKKSRKSARKSASSSSSKSASKKSRKSHKGRKSASKKSHKKRSSRKH